MKTSAPVVASLICIVAGGCGQSPPPATPPDWQTYHAGEAFSFKAPPDLKPVPVQGIDSLVGAYESPTLRLTFDYGMYSGGNTSGASTRIDGRKAWIGRKGNRIKVSFPKVKGGARLTKSRMRSFPYLPYLRVRTSITGLTMSVDSNGTETLSIEKIFKTIDFP